MHLKRITQGTRSAVLAVTLTISGIVAACGSSDPEIKADEPPSTAGTGGSGSGATGGQDNPGIGNVGNIGNIGNTAGATTGPQGTPQPPPPSALPSGGDVLLPGFAEADKTKFDGAPAPAAAPTVAYPLPHALFPANMAPVEIHLSKTVATQSIAKVTFKVEEFELNLYQQCAAAELDAQGCVLTIPADVCKKLGEANYFGKLTTTVRLADPSGDNLGEALLDDVSWTYSILTGGLYYWTTINQSTTAIKRYDFSKAADTPEVYWSQNPDSPRLEGTKYSADEHSCMGCHAISLDGSKMALTFGGSLPSAFALVDVASKTRIASRLNGDEGYAAMTTFSPDSKRFITQFRGKLLLRGAEATLEEQGELFPELKELKSHPFWAPTGDQIAFVTFKFTPDPRTPVPTGDVVSEAGIWIAPADGEKPTGSATPLVAADPSKSSYYPAISDDGKFVVYNESSCTGPTISDWGGGACDGYNDISARLMVIPSSGGSPVALDTANGYANLTNSWPRWSPDHGKVGEQTIYWIAFSSRRPYGLRLPGVKDPTKPPFHTSKPQLWFAAVRLTPGKPIEADPSFAPVWLPGQNDDMKTPTGNHVPQWVLKAVPISVK